MHVTAELMLYTDDANSKHSQGGVEFPLIIKIQFKYPCIMCTQGICTETKYQMSALQPSCACIFKIHTFLTGQTDLQGHIYLVFIQPGQMFASLCTPAKCAEMIHSCMWRLNQALKLWFKLCKRFISPIREAKMEKGESKAVKRFSIAHAATLPGMLCNSSHTVQEST